ncbi:MAG: hypothetical protein RLZZ383_2800 [Pseudomonadota bacterium]
MTWTRRALLAAAGGAALLPGIARPERRSAAAVRRLVVFVVPNGMPDALWTPGGAGAGWLSTGILDALADVRDEVAVITGLANVPSYLREHANSLPTVLYGGRPEVVGGASLDQRIARLHEAETLFPSLQIASERDTPCLEQGVACTRRRAVSWRSPEEPAPVEVSAEGLYRRLAAPVAAGTWATAFARDRRAALAGAGDGGWLAGLDAVDRRVTWPRAAACGDVEPPVDRALLYGDDAHIEAMIASASAALACDLTRVVTYMLGYAGSNRPLSGLGVPLGHHELSHTDFVDGHLRFGRWAVGHWARWVSTLAQTPDPQGGRLLDSTDVVFVSDMGDGTTHGVTRLPVLLAGPIAGAWRGQHVPVDEGRPLADLWLGLGQAHGLSIDRFGEDGRSPLTAPPASLGRATRR